MASADANAAPPPAHTEPMGATTSTTHTNTSATHDHTVAEKAIPPSTAHSSSSSSDAAIAKPEHEKPAAEGTMAAIARETGAVEAEAEREKAEEHHGALSEKEKKNSMALHRTHSSVYNPPDAELEYPKGVKLATITLALCLAVLCVALDNTIIATAIPRITDDFKALQDV